MKDLRTVFLVGTGGFLGANARFWLGTWMQSRLGQAFPWNTLTINVTGSFIMGLFMGLLNAKGWSADWRFFLAVGVLGGYTTFSSFSYEALTLLSAKSYANALLYMVGSVILCVGGAFLGATLSQRLAS